MWTSWRRRLGAGIAAVALAASAGVGGAWASHQFSDVEDGTFFHDAIGDIVSAGCATGYGDNTFRQRENPTRGQFAYWMSNCSSRVSSVHEQVTLSAGESLASGARPSVEIEIPAAGTGGGFLVVESAWTAKPAPVPGALEGASTGPAIQFAGFGPCPCNVETNISVAIPEGGAGVTLADSADYWQDYSSELRRMSGSGRGVLRVEAGVERPVFMNAEYNVSGPGDDDIVVDMTLSAFYVPFGWDGGPDLVPESP